MQNSFKVFLYCCSYILLSLWGCKEALEDPPSTPKWVKKTAPYAWEEMGIDAENDGDYGIFIEWHPVTDEDLAGYRIYRTTDLDTGKFELIKEIDLYQILEADTSILDKNVSELIRYYYVVKSIDIAGNLSEPSDTINYTLIPPPGILSPSDKDAVAKIPEFKWQQDNTTFYFAFYFAIRLQDVSDLNDIITIWTCYFINRNIGEFGIIQIEFFGTEQDKPEKVLNYNIDSLYSAGLKSGTYRWKIKGIYDTYMNDDGEDIDESSGESGWVYFEVE